MIDHNPLTAQEIHIRLLNKSYEVDLASVYRNLQLFTKLSIIQSVEFGDGKKRYELHEENNHHHHFVCENCGGVQDFSSQLEKKMIKNVQKDLQVTVHSHLIELSGLCRKCS